jgi:hypothetical protein
VENAKKRKNLEKLSPADYSKLLALYLDDKKQKQALKLAGENLSALEMLVQFETMIAVNKRLEVAGGAADYKLPVYQIVEVAEKFFNVEDPNMIESELKGSKNWQAIKASPADFGLFQDTLAFLFTWGDRPMIPTPAYLKQLVMNRIYATAPAEDESTIVIRLKDGLRLIAGHISDLYNLSNSDEMVAVRSSGDTAVTANSPATGALQFMTTEPKQGDLFYQVVKDGNETVMLTVKLQNYRPRPKFINLRRQGRLLQSIPLRDDFAWFSQLSVGKYEIELQNAGSTAGKRIDIHIV